MRAKPLEIELEFLSDRVEGRELIGLAIAGRETAHHFGNNIYQFMNTNGIGASSLGTALDVIGRNRGVGAHRLFGHHVIYNLPWTEPSKIPDFLSHVVVSDGFTKQGLPIIPGEVAETFGFLKHVDGVKSNLNWNFLNWFDVAAGVTSIYFGGGNLLKGISGDLRTDEPLQILGHLARAGLSIGAGVYSANILLVIGGAMDVGGTVANIAYDQNCKSIENDLNSLLSLDTLIADGGRKLFGQDLDEELRLLVS